MRTRQETRELRSCREALWHCALLAATLLAAIVPATAFATPDDRQPRDPSFSRDGMRVFGRGVAHTVAVQSDRKILVAGRSARCEGWCLLRLDPNGSLDRSFSSNGWVPIPKPLGFPPQPQIEIGPDGKPVVLSGAVITRLTQRGRKDRSFGDRGRERIPQYTGSFAVQDDGRIVIASLGFDATADQFEVDVTRLLTNGELDASFGEGGVASAPFDTHLFFTGAEVALAPGGRVIAVASLQLDPCGTRACFLRNRFGLAAFTAEGELDPGFGGDGTVVPELGHDSDKASSLAVDSAGRVLVQGFACGRPVGCLELVRFLPDGSVDPTFGNAGLVYLERMFGNEAALAPDGEIAVAGRLRQPNRREGRWAVLSLTQNGARDLDFAPAGIAIDRTGVEAWGVTPDGSRKLIVVGSVRGRFSIVRYER